LPWGGNQIMVLFGKGDFSMIKKIKKWFGIEGVKLEVVIPESVHEAERVISGKLRFQSMNEQKVTGIKIALIERYSRGRGKEKLIDEYELGYLSIDKEVIIPADEIIEVPFTLPFRLVKSDVDEFGDQNLVFAQVSRLARLIRNAKSLYRVEAEAMVEGVGFNPFAKQEIVIKT